MTEAEIIEFVSALEDVDVLTASEASGAPEVAWGDSFFSHPAQAMPFATIVIKDYPGFDEASDVNREGVFRLNVGVGRERFTALLGRPPSADFSDVDYTALDTLLPHPAYAAQSFVSILNPGERTDALARELLELAHLRASGRSA